MLLECIHHTTKLSSIPGVGWDNLYLVKGLRAPHITRRVASEQDSWRTMEDVFDTISYIGRTEDRNKIYSDSNFESVPQVSTEWVQEVSTSKYTRQNPTKKTYNGPNHRSQNDSSISNRNRQYNSQPCRDKGSFQPNQGQRKLICYYCDGEHCIRDCEKFTKDKTKYKLKTMDLTTHTKTSSGRLPGKGTLQSVRYPVFQNQPTQCKS